MSDGKAWAAEKCTGCSCSYALCQCAPTAPFVKHDDNKPQFDREWLATFMEAQMKDMLEISRAKNADYTGSTDDPFANFKIVEAIGITSVEIGILTRMSDKVSRIASFVKKGQLQVKDESVTDTLKDLANYALLLNAYLQTKKEQP